MNSSSEVNFFGILGFFFSRICLSSLLVSPLDRYAWRLLYSLFDEFVVYSNAFQLTLHRVSNDVTSRKYDNTWSPPPSRK